MPIFRTPLILIAALGLLLYQPGALGQSIRPTSDRLDAIVAHPLIISIAVENERALRTGVITKLDDGRSFRSMAYWVGISPKPMLPGWTNTSGIWTATGYAQIIKLDRSQRPAGTWFINIPLPIDAVGQGLWIEGERYELNWLPDPERTMLEANHRSHQGPPEHSLDALWSMAPSPQALADPAVQAAIEHYKHDPFQSWRARLLTDGLDPAHTHQRQTLDALDLELSMNTPGADLLDALARQNEARWQIILGQLWLIDPAVAHRLKAQFIRTARFGNRILPIWTSDTIELAKLAHDLLSPFVDDNTRLLRANAWLENQPRALAWVSDDQGQIEAGTGRFIPTLNALALPQSAGGSLFEIQPRSSSPELATLAPNISTPLRVAIKSIPLSLSKPMLETQPVTLKTGRWSQTHHVIASPTPARAPYVRIGPLLNDWTMPSLLSNQPLAGAKPNPSRSTIGILRKVTTPSRANPTRGWQLYLELGSANPSSPNEMIKVWVGPYTNPSAVWSITPQSRVIFEKGTHLSMTPPSVRTQILNDRWAVMINLPEDAFDEDHILQLGLERIDCNQIHTAWPRRMIPDQPEPGRLSIQAGQFDEL